MNKTQKRQLNLRNKLFAAIAMLLVSSIMMVSTTYAWFTLSTAPEVQGITTTVGTNGNLEIALSPLSGETAGIGSTVGDATLGWTYKNTTWGNLLDLSNAEYELDKINLLPSQLQFTTNKVATETGGLAYPVYGSDGRISELEAGTSIGFKVDETTAQNAAELTLSEGFQISNASNPMRYGVRAIGTSSGQSENERVFAAGVNALRNGMNQAAGVASSGLNANGQALANMLVDHAMATKYPDKAGTEDYEKYSESLDALLTSLESSVNNIDSALKGAIKAYAATQFQDLELSVAVDTIDDPDNTVGFLIGEYAENQVGLDAALTQRNGIAEDVEEARGVYEDLVENDKWTWSDVSALLDILMNVSYVTINDLSYSTIAQDPFDLIDSVLDNNNTANIKMNENSGVYYDIHAMASKIYAPTEMSVDASVVMGGSERLITVNAVMETTYTGPTTLATMLGAVSALEEDLPTSDSTSVTKLDAYYGYILDFVFRTNAAGSNLQLQTEAANRVYSSDGSEATMGGGSTITFQVPAGVEPAIVSGMLNGIRVVFFDTLDGTVYGVAKATATETRITGEITSLVGKLQLCSYNENGDVNVGAALESNTLCALSQNQPKSVSVMVSLAGADITNEDILAEGNLSGVLNLQFSSSATLVPMQNTDLKDMESCDVNIGGVKVDSVEKGGTYTYTIADKASVASVTVTNNGEAVADAWNATTGVITVPNVQGTVEITVTKAAAPTLTATTVTITTALTEDVQVTVNGRKTAAAAANEAQNVTVNANSQTVTVYTGTDVDYTVTVPDGYTVTESPDNTWTVTKSN